MLNKIIILLCAILFFGMQAQTIANETVEATTENVTPSIVIIEKEYKIVAPLELVATPAKYMNKKIKLHAKFDKFATLGLDYPPANRDTKNHISFLIKRENVTNYNIPLSELKLILKRDYAEKELVNLEAGDEIDIYGTVFCMALGDPWVDVEKVVILTPKTNKDTK